MDWIAWPTRRQAHGNTTSPDRCITHLRVLRDSLCPHLGGKLHEILGHDIERTFRCHFAGAGPAFAGTSYMTGMQTLRCGSSEIAAVGRHHHALAGLEIKRF